MESREPFSFKKRVRSFGCAIHGLCRFFKTEHNLWIHLVAAVLVVILGLLLRLSRMEWVAIIVVIAMVMSAEAFNTCIEKAMDHLYPEEHENIRYIKDLAAGAVLITAAAAAIAGLIIFIPKVVGLF